jgi:hypothetical protein
VGWRQEREEIEREDKMTGTRKGRKDRHEGKRKKEGRRQNRFSISMRKSTSG